MLVSFLWILRKVINRFHLPFWKCHNFRFDCDKSEAFLRQCCQLEKTKIRYKSFPTSSTISIFGRFFTCHS